MSDSTPAASAASVSADPLLAISEAQTLPPIDTQPAHLVAANNALQGITADEVALYDRQIRLWGMDAQEKIRNANILLVTLKALGNEIAKNLVLAGINSLTVIDDILVAEEDLAAQFLISQDDLGKTRAVAAQPSLQKLNPRVPIHIRNAQALFGEPDFITQFDMVIVTDLAIPMLNAINAKAHFASVPFYAAGSHGFYGYVFADLVSHTFSLSRDKSNMTTKPGTQESPTRVIVDVQEKREPNGKVIETITKRETYQPLILANTAPLPATYLTTRRRLRTVSPLLPCLRALWEFETGTNGVAPSHTSEDLQTFTRLAMQKAQELQLPPDHLRSEFLRSFLQNLYGEIAPVAAFLGGVLAQDVINVLGGREQPIQNMMLFDGEETEGRVYALVPALPAEVIVTPTSATGHALPNGGDKETNGGNRPAPQAQSAPAPVAPTGQPDQA